MPELWTGQKTSMSDGKRSIDINTHMSDVSLTFKYTITGRVLRVNVLLALTLNIQGLETMWLQTPSQPFSELHPETYLKS